MTLKCLALFMMLLSLSSVMAGAQEIITPEQAMQSVHQFLDDPAIPLVIDAYWPNGNLTNRGDTGRCGKHYRIVCSAGPHRGEWFYVHATDGVILWAEMQPDSDGTVRGHDLRVTLPVARQLATQYLQQHYPAFSQGKWQLLEKAQINDEPFYEFEWIPILNAQYGTRGLYSVTVKLDGNTGSVFGYDRPKDTPITGPTEPRILLKQARRLAGPFAAFDPKRVPFSQETLQLCEDPVGIQYLQWDMQQYPVDQGFHRGMQVDATTGEVSYGFNALIIPFGGLTEKLNKSRRPLPAKPRAIQLRTHAGDAFWSVTPPVIENDQVWARAELLRGVEATVDVEPKSLHLVLAGKTLSAETLGAKFHDGGWWVPVRKAVEMAGGKFTWRPDKREVLLEMPTASQAVPLSK